MNLEGKKVTIIGVGKSGMAAAKLVSHCKGKVKVSDQNPQDKVSEDFKSWVNKEKIPVEFGGHTKSFIQDSDLVVLSPGVRIDAQPVQWAREKNIPVISEIELASLFCSKPIIAITGSNGKTTVSTLISKMIEASGKKACLCGNIGSPFSQYVFDLNEIDYVVLEVSSFQLEAIVDFKPYIAVFLNFSQNHLDRHKDMDEYWEAKKRIFVNQDENDFAVLNNDDSKIKSLSDTMKAKAVCFGLNDDIDGFDQSNSNPNYIPVLAVANILGIHAQTCKKVFEDFKGVEHRLEKVRVIDGVDYVNDSKATTVEAGRWAIMNTKQSVIMICGGRDKNIDFSLLKNLVKENVKKMIVIGEAKDKIKKAFEDVVTVEECDQLKDAVLTAKNSAVKGDCVLLSPMCASFDMFLNFEERGKVFKEIVLGL